MPVKATVLPLDRQLELSGLGRPCTEYRFHQTRKWRFDFAYVPQRIAIEVDGGVFVGGRHSRGSGVEDDCEKYAEALVLGWRILRVTPRMVKDGRAVRWTEQLLKGIPHGLLV
jgi:very-short-patch-repair endonuclease